MGKQHLKENCLKSTNGVKFKLYDIIDHLEAGVSVNSEEGKLKGTLPKENEISTCRGAHRMEWSQTSSTNGSWKS